MINPSQLILKLERNGPYIMKFCIVNMTLLLILEIIDEQVNKKSIRLKNRLDFFYFPSTAVRLRCLTAGGGIELHLKNQPVKL